MKKILIGKNSTGKTEYLKNNYKDYLKLFDISQPDNEIKLTTASQMLTSLISEKILNEEINNSDYIKSLNDALEKKLRKKLPLIFKDDDFDDKVILNYEISNIEEIDLNLHKIIKFKNTYGSGHSLYLLLKLYLEFGVKDQKIIIDEPESFLHESLQIKVSELLKEFSKTNDVIVSTHSPVFASNFIEDISEVIVFNNKIDPSHEGGINHEKEPLALNDNFFDDIANDINKLNPDFSKLKTQQKFDDEFLNGNSFDGEKIKVHFNKHKIQIMKSLFYNDILLVEGLLERILIETCIQNEAFQNSKYIFDAFGKWTMPILIIIIQKIGAKVKVIYDVDTNDFHIELNKLIDILLEVDDIVKFSPNADEELEIPSNMKTQYYSLYKFIQDNPTKLELFKNRVSKLYD